MMETITIDGYINGYGLRVYSPKDGYALNETHEERLEALNALHTWVESERRKELEARRQAAGIVL